MYQQSFQGQQRDANAVGELRHSVLASWLESAQEEYLAAVGRRCGGHALRWRRTSLRLDMFHAVRARDGLDLEVAIVEIGRSSITIGCRFLQHKMLCAVGNCELESRDMLDRQVMPLSDTVRAALEQEVLGFLRMRSEPLAG